MQVEKLVVLVQVEKLAGLVLLVQTIADLVSPRAGRTVDPASL